MAQPLDRRRAGHTRLPIRVPTEVERLGGADGRQRGEALDLGPGGLRVRLEEGLDPGAPVRITLRLSRHPVLTLVGTVAWAQPHPDLAGWALGISFNEELPEGMAAEIADAEFPPWTSSPRAAGPPATR